MTVVGQYISSLVPWDVNFVTFFAILFKFNFFAFQDDSDVHTFATSCWTQFRVLFVRTFFCIIRDTVSYFTYTLRYTNKCDGVLIPEFSFEGNEMPEKWLLLNVTNIKGILSSHSTVIEYINPKKPAEQIYTVRLQTRVWAY